MFLLIDNYDSFTYNIYDYFLQLGAHVEIKKNDEIDEIMTRLKFDKDKIKDNYNYLTKMPMDSVSKENVSKIINEHNGDIQFLKKNNGAEINIYLPII